ncbi:AIM24 family protein [Kineococcus sp. T13]|uniref:AIM24 family protein n=1 Tax=Kineococcus vitellinus TaxID=2696565 RepID=UPI0014130945|nr:AIM24 family protein [Kineococcus vitellinus]NAZ74974.1 AIM24 family protein [Kineococcus vitellinus]
MAWRLESPRVLVVELDGGKGSAVRAQTGSMVAYEGDVQFKNAGTGGGGGLRAAFKQRLSGESLSLMDITGRGSVHLAVGAGHVLVLDLAGDTLKAESEGLLCLSEGLRTDVAFTGLQGASSGQGLFTTTVSGHGRVALLSLGGPPIALRVGPQTPLVVDPDAYIGCVGELRQSFVTDVSWRNLLGEDSGEAFSLRFEGSGVVYVQPEER